MNDSSYQTGPTLLSLWSAMLGGAVGGAAGKLTSSVLCNGTVGFFASAVASVLVHMVLYLPVYVVAMYVAQAEMGDHAVGNYKSDMLASVSGGIAGLCASVIVTLALPTHSLTEPHAFAVCWSVVTIVPLVIVLGLMWHAR